MTISDAVLDAMLATARAAKRASAGRAFGHLVEVPPDRVIALVEEVRRLRGALLDVHKQLLNHRATSMEVLFRANLVAGVQKALDGDSDEEAGES